jgi:hypothetical protein
MQQLVPYLALSLLLLVVLQADNAADRTAAAGCDLFSVACGIATAAVPMCATVHNKLPSPLLLLLLLQAVPG